MEASAFQTAGIAPGMHRKAPGRHLFEDGKAAAEEEVRPLEKPPAMIRFKCRYYETAIPDGNENGISAMPPDHE